MASGEEDDPIIQEIDVYLAKSLSEKLYLFQYPVRPANMNYDDTTHLTARIKPKQQKVEIEVAIDTMSPNYCRSKGEQIALNVDGTSLEDSSTYSIKMMDKQTFSSIQATTNTSRYAAAVFRKGELHLTPLQGILQMRPSFSYLDKADSKHKEREAANEGGDSSQDEAEDDAKQITVRFSRPESEQARQRRIQSYEFLQKKQAEEPWVHLHYHSLKDGRSEHERQYLYCQAMDTTENMELVKTPNEYLTMLMPPLTEEKAVKPVGPSNVLSMAQLRTLPLGDQVKTLMKNVKVMPFANLMGLLASGTDYTAVLRCIQQVAMLVQGNWVVKSDVLYPKSTCSPHSGVPAEVLCRGRDFVMWRFTNERSLMRKEVAAIIKLPPEDVKDFLEHMAVPRANRGWEFLLPTDRDFVKKHPDVAQRQHMLWLGIQNKLEKVFNFSKEDFLHKKDTQMDSVHVSGEQRLKVARENARERHASLQKDLDARRLKASSMSSGSSGTNTMVQIKQEPMSDSEESMDTSGAVPNGSVNGYPSSDSPNTDLHSEYGTAQAPTPELQDFVRSTFRKHFVLCLSEVKRLFNLHLASLPTGHSRFGHVTDRMLQDTILHSHCKQILVPFPPQSSSSADEQKVFGLWENGETFDRHRQVLFEIFMKNYRVRRNVIQTRLSQELGDAVTKADVDRLLKECCISLGGMWYLKGTVQS
ncbi:DNA-directed RNA polymerase III subunit RPC5 [Neoarius graeffei]|uniref:DNA-directed RNA polymerase III subunit RPC5 n=1 Tax=Neoarius graeffei TaxID=443677 RepID=UPI00298CAC0E|nr:DNA-directed RNA polymerase III subunit RPC5 [Neoarius graeffei]XP_060795603.1 DNA-directed RNA polymerase III subunit RPC5 [Neoarius graeffei]XP_060795604.1 DNA-directed RNA polymerase III subunit RPC5 [Neoarius graeffei]XP_060795605.1 DNA-directed RNA polymerase III subunit RPC5 [Neoarius graeffei]